MELSTIIGKLKGRQANILGYHDLPKYAVLLPLIEKEGETHILFEVRSLHLRRQPGDICFPGGRIEQGDRNESECAIRETSEELGIDPLQIKDVIPLDFMFNAAHNLIYPFIGRITNPDTITPNQSEVGEVFTVPLSYFLHTKPKVHKLNFQVIPEEDFPFDLLIGGENYKWQIRSTDEYFYQYNGNVIWGLTAKILLHFLSLLENKSI